MRHQISPKSHGFLEIASMAPATTSTQVTIAAVPGTTQQAPRSLGRVSHMAGPGDACAEDDGGAVDDGEFVVAGGQAAPLFE